jgi:hypothetical protein
MIWLLLALPVLLGLVRGADAAAARTLVLRCAAAGAVVGAILGVLLVTGTSHIPLGRGFVLPSLWGTIFGAFLGLVGVVVHRVRAR